MPLLCYVQAEPFRFKQFSVYHGPGLKLTTDAVFFGAWAQYSPLGPLLDLGTGTGILALMAAQRYPTISKIDAIENNPEALDYAQKNLSQSPFSQRFTLHAADVDTFAPPHLFADIICNPPFYVDALPRQNATLTLALHADAGLLARWLQQATQALLPTGSIHLMLQPTARAEALALATQYHLTLQREAYLHHSPKHPPLRWLGTLAGTTTPTPPQKHWHIHESGTKAFDPFYKNLLKDFYLGF